MSFLNNLGQKISDVSQTTIKKTKDLAIARAKELFGADYANVQPHSGSQANSAVFLALLNAGDTILGMSLAHAQDGITCI